MIYYALGMLIVLVVLVSLMCIFERPADIGEAKEKVRQLALAHFPGLRADSQMEMLQKELLRGTEDFVRSMRMYKRWNIAMGTPLGEGMRGGVNVLRSGGKGKKNEKNEPMAK